jgi:hypothetical protein
VAGAQEGYMIGGLAKNTLEIFPPSINQKGNLNIGFEKEKFSGLIMDIAKNKAIGPIVEEKFKQILQKLPSYRLLEIGATELNSTQIETNRNESDIFGLLMKIDLVPCLDFSPEVLNENK